MSYSVFVSHSGDDTYVAEHLLRPKLATSGARIFLDADRIKFGDDYRDIIFSELEQCDEVVALFTVSALERPWVFAEIGAAIAHGKSIIAMRYGPSEGDLQERGVLSILGTKHLLPIDKLDNYVEQLSGRVEASRK